jgi:hypothetical protein
MKYYSTKRRGMSEMAKDKDPLVKWTMASFHHSHVLNEAGVGVHDGVGRLNRALVVATVIS